MEIAAETVRSINPENPPSLAFTTVQTVILGGKTLPPAETYWNPLLIAAIRAAKSKLTTERISELLLCNHVIGRKEDHGYKYFEDIGISAQGQDANNAWKSTYRLLKTIKLPAEVTFFWQDNRKAAAPGARGKIVLEWN